MKQQIAFLLLSSLFILSGCGKLAIFLPIPYSKKIKKEYYTGGQLRSEFITEDKSGQSGILKKYGFNGNVTSIAHIKNGVRDGTETWFDKKGRVLMRVPYVHGKKHGRQEAYYENGDTMITISYKNGVKNGPAITYRRDGTIYSKQMFKNGKIISL